MRRVHLLNFCEAKAKLSPSFLSRTLLAPLSLLSTMLLTHPLPRLSLQSQSSLLSSLRELYLYVRSLPDGLCVNTSSLTHLGTRFDTLCKGPAGEIDVEVQRVTLLNPATSLPFVPSNVHNLVRTLTFIILRGAS
jgi:hypothetical protein